MSIIFHLDLDAFFVSVERILDPKLNGKPVVVGGDPQGRGVVAACSYEAREYGLHSAMPIKQAYKLCPHAIYLHGHHEEYVRFSRMVKEILSKYPPTLEQASIDEFYMDFSGTQKIYGSLYNLAIKIQKEILRELKLPSSIGIASNKTIAKIASDFMKPQGITYVMPGMEKSFLEPLPIQAMPGVGKVTTAELNSKGIFKIGDISKLPIDFFGCRYGKAGIDIWKKANGEGSTNFYSNREQKSISKETTFSEDVTSKEVLKKTIFKLTGKVCQTLRDHEFVASTVTIKLRYSDFQTITRNKKIKPTDDDGIIFETAWNLVEKANTRRIAVRLIGIGLQNFLPFSEQEELFVNLETSKRKLFRAVNILRSKYDYSIIKIGEM